MPNNNFSMINSKCAGCRGWSPSESLGSPRKDTEDELEAKVEKMSSAVKSILECVGEDPEREGLAKTPERFAKAMMFFTNGYTQTLSGKNDRVLSLNSSITMISKIVCSICLTGKICFSEKSLFMFCVRKNDDIDFRQVSVSQAFRVNNQKLTLQLRLTRSLFPHTFSLARH